MATTKSSKPRKSKGNGTLSEGEARLVAYGMALWALQERVSELEDVVVALCEEKVSGGGGCGDS